MPSGQRPLNVAEHHSICEMAEKILVVCVVLTSKNVKYGKIELNKNGLNLHRLSN